MKRFICVLLAFAMILGLSGCAPNTDGDGQINWNKVEDVVEAQLSEGALTVEPATIPVGQRTTVTFTLRGADITDPVLKLDDGTTVALTENSEDGYTGQATFTPDERGGVTATAQWGDDFADQVTVAFTSPITEKEEQALVDINEMLTEAVSPWLEDGYVPVDDLEPAAKALVEELEELEEEGFIQSYALTETGCTVVSADGLGYVYDIVKVEGMWASSSTAPDPQTANLKLPSDGNTILLIQPFVHEHDCEELEKACGSIVRGCDGYEMQRSDGSDAEQLMHLDLYDIVIWEGHGGYSNGVAYICTNISCGDLYELYPEMADDAGSFETAPYLLGGNSGDPETRIVITGKWFEYYYPAGSLNNTLFMFIVCKTAINDSFPRALTRKGATVYAFTGATSNSYGHDMAMTIMDCLADGMTASEALKKAKNAHGKKDYEDFLNSNLAVIMSGGKKGENIDIADINYLKLYGDKSWTVPQVPRWEGFRSVWNMLELSCVQVEMMNWDDIYGYSIPEESTYVLMGTKDDLAMSFGFTTDSYGDVTGGGYMVTIQDLAAMEEFTVNNARGYAVTPFIRTGDSHAAVADVLAGQTRAGNVQDVSFENDMCTFVMHLKGSGLRVEVSLYFTGSSGEDFLIAADFWIPDLR